MAKKQSSKGSTRGGSKRVDPPAISTSEFVSRREKVLRSLKGAPAVVFAGEGSAPISGKWVPNQHFLYLTGIESEPGAALLFDPSQPDASKRIVLFLTPVDPEGQRWDGYRPEISSALKEQLGFSTIYRTGGPARYMLSGLLTHAARRAKRLACLHPFAVPPVSPGPDLILYRQIAERIPGVSIEDRTMLLPEMRSIKSKGELALMRKAAEVTAAGYDRAFEVIGPGVSERDIHHALVHTYQTVGIAGGSGTPYNPIVAAGINATILHYNDNDCVVGEDDLILIDSGSSYHGYACDVTRAIPASGRFSRRQREIYEIVLESQLAGIKAAKAGAYMWQVDKATRDVIAEAGYADTYIHGVGHQLGLETHDATPDGPLAPGMVITIEPGVYLPDEKLGVRIEDDILITASGNQNLTSMIPKSPEEVEKALSEGRRRAGVR